MNTSPLSVLGSPERLAVLQSIRELGRNGSAVAPLALAIGRAVVLPADELGVMCDVLGLRRNGRAPIEVAHAAVRLADNAG